MSSARGTAEAAIASRPGARTLARRCCRACSPRPPITSRRGPAHDGHAHRRRHRLPSGASGSPRRASSRSMRSGATGAATTRPRCVPAPGGGRRLPAESADTWSRWQDARRRGCPRADRPGPTRASPSGAPGRHRPHPRAADRSPPSRRSSPPAATQASSAEYDALATLERSTDERWRPRRHAGSSTSAGRPSSPGAGGSALPSTSAASRPPTCSSPGARPRRTASGSPSWSSTLRALPAAIARRSPPRARSHDTAPAAWRRHPRGDRQPRRLSRSRPRDPEEPSPPRLVLAAPVWRRPQQAAAEGPDGLFAPARPAAAAPPPPQEIDPLLLAEPERPFPQRPNGRAAARGRRATRRARPREKFRTPARARTAFGPLGVLVVGPSVTGTGVVFLRAPMGRRKDRVALGFEPASATPRADLADRVGARVPGGRGVLPTFARSRPVAVPRAASHPPITASDAPPLARHPSRSLVTGGGEAIGTTPPKGRARRTTPPRRWSS